MSGRGRGQRRQDVDGDTRSDLDKFSGAAGHFAGAMLNELGRRGQSPYQKPHSNTKSSHAPTTKEHQNSHRVCYPKGRSGEQKAGAGHKGHSVNACNKRPPSQHELIMPYVHKTGLLKPTDIIFICGIPKPKAERFTVYLQNGGQFQPSCISFCIDVRFVFGRQRNCVVRNHKDGGNGWGMEERQIECFPFKAGEHFEMIILVEKDCFKVAVNDNHMFHFNHRVRKLDRIDTLRIDGDITLTQVRLQT